VLFSDQPEEGPAGIGARDHDVGADFLAAFEHCSFRSSALDHDFLNGSAGADLGAE
jgi:hypothetical protein